MYYSSKQLPDRRWGIFINNELVASIGCQETCHKILQFLETRLSQKSNLRDRQTNSLRNSEMQKLRQQIAEKVASKQSSNFETQDSQNVSYFESLKLVS